MNIDCESLNNPKHHYLDEAGFRALVAECAYFMSEQRGFVEGHALEDWLAAEKEVSKRCHYWLQ